ncbi:putative ATP-dependent DNA helicase [Gordonia hirsuta DSM 44140 = NBRC 16056]|uniref:DNA 3'-5' helicase n=1 Tax=Gordonia hirsuta DSM 44140 = NBRC 16056 TaxID=1121927 RepID=L7L606_9ACTN|nr:UvrD-helicase domain-containing protein [Gordonia hirsuta]GAC56379.1 putative ATP-dependent DNA helicase [Gordonia hirsuta DSM 44140 = NBRC 16056]
MTDPTLGPGRRIPARTLAAALELPPPTDEQVEVIEAPLEPMLVVAGAGAGKTETMASRVVWLVANRLVAPDEILGLTFTRKAASELGARIRRRLSMLAGSAALLDLDPGGELAQILRSADAEVSTYHAYAGRLIADYGLLLPVEPSSTLLSETELWQLAFSVVTTWPHPLETTKVPAGVTETVLNLYSEMAEHLVDDDALLAAGSELYTLIDTLPRAARQRAEPSQTLRAIQAVIDERRRFLPLVQALRDRMREQGALDFGSQMSLAARLVTGRPEVVATERAGIKAVLLDEYQDTGHSQRLLLSALFGGAPSADRPPIAVTAVGDPIQSIYGWRGASAANLPRFADDFPRADGTPAPRRELLTSWRNCRGTLYLANEVSGQLRARGVPVSTLRPRDSAPDGTVRLALTETVADERAWIADHIEQAYQTRAADGAADVDRSPPTVAVLVRRNEDSAPLAAELEARGIPVEVVGIGGLLHVPEITDIVATLRLMADPMAGTAVMRLLTGARWQLGAADLAVLWRRARDLAAGDTTPVTGAVDTREALDEALAAALPTESVDAAGLGDALVDPGPADRYSAPGYARIRAFGQELERLRRRIGQPLPELVADVEQTIGVAVEAQLRARRMHGPITGREHLDAFAEYVAAYAERPGATLPGLLSFLDAAETVEKGLEAGQVEVAQDRVQILTVHAAKGLEWDIVAVPHLARGIFPSAKADTTWLGSARELPAQLRGDLADAGSGDEGFPPLHLAGLGDRKELETALTDHKDAIKARRLDEDRRLLYVALTRAKDTLLVSAHHWSDAGDKPRGGSEFYLELVELVIAGAQVQQGMSVDIDVPAPEDGAQNPMTAEPVTARWPVDRLGDRRPALIAAAEAVAAARAERALIAEPAAATDDPEILAWRGEVAALLAEREQSRAAQVDVELPAQLSVSQLVELGADQDAFAARLRRPVPFRPNPMARRGTAFHAWVERRFGATRLLDIDELPGAADESAVDNDLDVLRTAFLASPWADRTPLEVEVGFETELGSTVVRGRMDAVFADGDGFLVVDWKTGAVPERAGREALELQLAAYRVAWARLRGVALDRVRAAFVYVRHGYTLEPDNLPDAEQLGELLARSAQVIE